MAENQRFSHFDATGKARMVDVSQKSETERQAIAAGSISCHHWCME